MCTFFLLGFGKKLSKKQQRPSSKTKTSKKQDSYIEISNSVQNLPEITRKPQPVINDPSKPEVDDQGYTLYTNEETGEKSRVFEALLDYPCEFKIKVVGANEGPFVRDMVQLVASHAKKNYDSIKHSVTTVKSGKWVSVTIMAPVESSQMLYELYEIIDRDPRVKFKF